MSTHKRVEDLNPDIQCILKDYEEVIDILKGYVKDVQKGLVCIRENDPEHKYVTNPFYLTDAIDSLGYTMNNLDFAMLEIKWSFTTTGK